MERRPSHDWRCYLQYVRYDHTLIYHDACICLHDYTLTRLLDACKY